MRAIDRNLALCRTCRSLTDRPGEPCAYCGSRTEVRAPNGLQRVWAFWLAGIIAYIPGNLYPIMLTESYSGTSESTIVGSIVSLLHHGSYGIALVILVVSLLVPISKFVIIAWLALSVQHGWATSRQRRLEAHEVIEFVGRWSMVDVFVVAALAALIQVGSLMTVKPGIGINAFALSVVFTMLSAMSFDPRRIWDVPTHDNG